MFYILQSLAGHVEPWRFSLGLLVLLLPHPPHPNPICAHPTLTPRAQAATMSVALGPQV